MIIRRSLIQFTVAALCTLTSAAGPDFWSEVNHLAREVPVADLPDSLLESDVHYFRSCLTPGILIRMKSSRLDAFTGLARYGAESPSFFLVETVDGARAFKRGEAIRGEQMAASWLVTSFQGCKGWEQFDVPWFLSFEKRPDTIELNRDGLLVKFHKEDTGYVFSMPLYGYYKPPQEDNDFATQNGLPSASIQSWTWKEKPPADLIRRCGWWAEVAKSYPIGFQESFRVDPNRDEITFRQDYEWLTIDDDWGTRPRRFATVSPSLGLAWQARGFPMEFSAPIHDPHYFTSFGPYIGAENVDRLETTLKVLQYTHELEYLKPPAHLKAHHEEALKLIISGMQSKFQSASRYQYDHGGKHDFCWNIVGDVWYPRALPYVPASLKETARSSLRLYMQNDVLRPHTAHKGKYVLEGPGIASFGEWGDAGKFMTNALQPIWAYGEYTGDWQLIRSRWDLIKKFFITPEEADWLTFGRQAIAEIGDEAAPCSAYARMAWAVGDLDQYLLGTYMFARELVHLYVKQRGGKYFYDHQPYNQYEPMPRRIYPTDIWGSTRGWQVDGPTWGHLPSGEHQSANRWYRFHDPDVGRFYRDWLKNDVRSELDAYAEAAEANREAVYRLSNYREWTRRDQPHMMTSLIRLQSFLLGSRYQQLFSLGRPSSFHTGWGAADIAVGYAFLRSMVPVAWKRVVPRKIGPSPFVLGLHQRSLEERLTTVQDIWEEGLQIEPRWFGWHMPKSPTGDEGHRSFGTIRGDFKHEVSAAQGVHWISNGCAVVWADSESREITANHELLK